MENRSFENSTNNTCKLFCSIGVLLLFLSSACFVYTLFFSYRGNVVLLATYLYLSMASMIFLCACETVRKENFYYIFLSLIFICVILMLFLDYVNLPYYIGTFIYFGLLISIISIIFYIYGFFIPYLCRNKGNPSNIFISFVFMFFSNKKIVSKTTDAK